MIQILTVKDDNTCKEICRKASIIYNNDLHIIAVHDDNGVVCEGAIFKYSTNFGEILWIDMGDDFDLAEGLARAILSIMEIRGVQSVKLPIEYEQLAKKLRFVPNNDHFVVSLDGYFCCGCKHD